MTAPPEPGKSEVPDLAPGLRLDRRRMAWFCLVLLGVLVLFFHRSVVGGRLLSAADLLQHPALIGDRPPLEPAHRLLSDSVYQFEPWRRLNWRSLKEGRLLHWDRTTYSGAPFVARYQTAPFHPLRLVPAAEAPRIHALCHLLELFLAGLGFYLLVAALGFGEPSRWLAGLAWSLSGFLVVWRLWPHSAAAGPLPWILFGLVLFQSGRRFGGLAATCAGVTLSWLGGHPQTTVMVLTVVFAYAVFRCLNRSDERSRWTGGLAWAGATLLSTGLAAFFLLPGFGYLVESHAWNMRTPLFWGFQSGPAPNLISIPGFFLPYVFGSRLAGHLPLDAWLGAANTSELAGGYVSIVLVAGLLPIALIRRHGSETRFWLLLLLLSLALAAKVPLLAAVFRNLPLLGAASPERWVLFAGLAELMIAVTMLESLQRRPLARKKHKALVMTLLLAGVVSVAVAGTVRAARPWVESQIEERKLLWSQRLQGQEFLAHETSSELTARLEKTTVQYPLWIGLLLLLTAFAIHLTRAGPQWLPVRSAPLIGLVVLDLFVFGYGYNPTTARAAHFPKSETIRFLERHLGEFRLAAAEKALPPNVFSYFGLADVRGYDAMEPALYMQAVIRVFGMERSPPSHFKFYAHDDYTHPFGDFLGLKFLVTRRPLPSLVGESRRLDRFRLVLQPGRDVYIYENTSALPGYYLANRLVAEPDLEQRLRRIEGWRSEDRLAVVEEGPERSFTPNSNIRMVASGSSSLTFEAEIREESFLVVAQNYLPGWSCLVDGVAAPLVRTNHAFLGVALRPGARRVEFRYLSPAFSAGLWISLAALLLLTSWAVLEWRAGRDLGARAVQPDGA